MAGPGQEPPDHRPPVLFLRPMHKFIEEPLSAFYRFLKPWESSSSPAAAATAAVSGARIVLCKGTTPVDAAAIAGLPRLECVVTTSAGLNHVDLDECRRRGIVVANAGGVFSDDVADYAVGLLVDVMRRVSAADRYVRKGSWGSMGEFPLGSKIGGKRVGIVGLGNIGTEIAKRLEAFNCIIGYNSRNEKSVSYAYFPDVCKLASWCDVLILSCALNDETKHIAGKDVLAALGKEGVIINIGRGLLIDEKELVRCLKEGEIGGAGLDVFENEPQVPSDLFEMDNVVLSPHCSVTTPESFSDLLQLVKTNLQAFFSNKPLPSQVAY